ncbi:MAG: CPBP family intramembrane glutamic endopeptidase [Rhodanobacter sp.]
MAWSNPWSKIGLYLGLVLALSSIFYTLIIATGHLAGGHGRYVTGLMWCPAVAAMLTCRITGMGLDSLGWGWGRWRWQWLAYLLPLGYATVAYVIVWITGLGSFGDPAFIASIATDFGWTGAPHWILVSGYVLLTGSVGMVLSVATGLGEEIGWRGFLVPQVTQALGFTKGVLLTGAIWSLWHMPILLFADYNSGTPWWVAMPCFAVLVFSISVPMAWLRLRSGSLWPCAVLHASHNLFIQTFFTPITAKTGWITPYAIDEFGFMLPLVALIVAFVFWRQRHQLPQMQP